MDLLMEWTSAETLARLGGQEANRARLDPPTLYYHWNMDYRSRCASWNSICKICRHGVEAKCKAEERTQ
jgi:hypothetical protein